MSGPYAFNRMANGEVLYAPKINELQQGIEELWVLNIPIWESGLHYDSRLMVGGNAGKSDALPKDTVYYLPFPVGPSGITVEKIGTAIFSGAAGNARLGVYHPDPNTGTPGALVDECGIIDVSSSGVKEITINTTYHGLPGTPYIYLAYLSNAEPSINVIGKDGGVRGTPNSWIGRDATTFWGNSCFYQQPYAYGALPATASIDGRWIGPVITLKVA